MFFTSKIIFFNIKQTMFYLNNLYMYFKNIDLKNKNKKNLKYNNNKTTFWVIYFNYRPT